MNNENKARIRTVWTMIGVSIITMLFGVNPVHAAQMKELVVYNKNILYINKYINLVNIKNIINIDYINNNINNRLRSAYLVTDFNSGNNFIMPDYSIKLNLNSRVDNRVIISRLANAIKSQETGGVGAYYRKSYSSSACGAYQYMQDTWNNFMGYKSACDAPEWVQDQRMIAELKSSYKTYGSWPAAVAAHLCPSRAGNVKTWFKPVPGNPTVFQYVSSIFQQANIAF